MPVRSRAVEILARTLADGEGPVFNTLDDTVRLGGETITHDAYERRYDAAYVAMVDDINWNRVLIEASARHMELEHADEGYDGYVAGVVGTVCPECVNEVMLSVTGGGWQDWKNNPKAKR